MANITIRNIPDDVFSKIQRLSSIEKRSVNSELLVIIDKGTKSEMEETAKRQKRIPASIQVNLWKNLSSKWKDSRSADEIISDIYVTRTTGREFEL